MAEQFTNDIQTTLSSGIDASTTSIPVASATGFPTSAQYRIRIENELLLVTAGAGTTTWTVAGRGSEGSVAAIHSSGADVHHILTAEALRTVVGEVRPDWLASDNALLAGNYDPGLAVDQYETQDGEILWSKVWAPTRITITNLVVLVSSPGEGFSAGNFGMVYSSSGTLIAKTAEQSTPWETGGVKLMALTAEGGQSLTQGGPGIYLICGVMSRATTNPLFGVRLMEDDTINMNLSGLGLRSGSDASDLAQTTAPATISGGDQTGTFRLVWFGLS